MHMRQERNKNVQTGIIPHRNEEVLSSSKQKLDEKVKRPVTEIKGRNIVTIENQTFYQVLSNNLHSTLP